MSRHPGARGPGSLAGEFSDARRPSFPVAGIGDVSILIGLLAVLCSIIGLADDAGESVRLGSGGIVVLGGGIAVRRNFVRPHRTPPNRILTGLGLIWCSAIAIGTVLYLITGSIDRVDDALLEATAGFSTTNLTTLDPGELSWGVVLFRSATQWIGGYMGILLSVVALPEALGGGALLSTSGLGGRNLVSDAARGRRRIMALYAGFTACVTFGYLITGLGGIESFAHGMSTASTGGFSTHADSFSSYGSGPRTVATLAMFTAGASIFVLWWLVRGRLRPIWRSLELRVYLLILLCATGLLMLDVQEISIGDALFTATSISSTTGFSVGDWAAWSDDAEGVLLVVAAIGSMLGSAGGGFRVARTQLLLKYALREMRRQLDPHAVVVVKHRGLGLDESTLHRLAGFQISHLIVCGVAAVALAALGTSVLGSVWGATSAVSTLGPAVGEIGSFGSVQALARPARLVLVPAMIAGRLAIIPALVIVVWGLRNERRIGLKARRMVMQMTRRVRRRSAVG